MGSGLGEGVQAEFYAQIFFFFTLIFSIILILELIFFPQVTFKNPWNGLGEINLRCALSCTNKM